MTVTVGIGSAGGSSPAPAASTSWTVYHGDPAGTGADTSITAVDTASAHWISPVLDGQLYGEPLEFAGRVFVATENDTMYALSAANGHVIWSTHVASPVPAVDLACGDITPTVGITGTPVIDPSRKEIFAVADEFVDGLPHHVLVGFSTKSGRVELRQDVDPPTANPAGLLQRTGLALDAGNVVFGMGDNSSSCGVYRGRIIEVNEKGGTLARYFTVDAVSPTDHDGGIWMGGAAPAVDAKGHIWVGSGNGSVITDTQPYDDSDAALELSSSLKLLQFFAPSDWPQNNFNDFDMSFEPAVLSDGLVVLAGKSEIAYLLNARHLGGIGGQESSLPVGCKIRGGSATVGATVYLPCGSGPIAVHVTKKPASLRLTWIAQEGGGPPIATAGEVWTISPHGVLWGLNAKTGAIVQHADTAPEANHFPTPGIGDGLLLVPSADQVYAYTTTSAVR